MKSRTFIALSFLFGLLQGPLLPPVFSEGILVVLFALYNRPQKFLPALFLGGLVFDLLQGQALGTTSLLFILSSLLVFVLREHLSLKNPIFLGIFASVVNLIRAKIIFGILPLSSSVVAALIAIFIFKFFWQPQESEYKI